MASIPFHLTGEALWRRMERAVERIQQRLEKTARTLEQADSHGSHRGSTSTS